MDVALRAVSWIWGFYFFGDADACRSAAFRASFLRALFMHGAFIASHLERGDVNGNHYLCDAVGLVFLGTFFRATSQGRSWLQIGKDIVDTEIFKQTSEDGVDFEKSTAYHRLVLEAFLTSHLLLERSRRAAVAAVARAPRAHGRVRRGVHQARWHRPAHRRRRRRPGAEAGSAGHQRSPVSAGGRRRAVQPRRLQARERRLRRRGVLAARGRSGRRPSTRSTRRTAPVESKAFDDGGFYVLRTDRAHVIVDCGEVGMHGRGGHGHSDITSLEIWLDGMNLVSDCGAYLYTASRDWRNRFRSTAFHNVRAGRRRGAESADFTRPSLAAPRRCAAAGRRVALGRGRRLFPRQSQRICAPRSAGARDP